MSLHSAGRERRIACAAIAIGLLIRAVVAALTPPLPDEAYYWEWSRHLAPGYFDHPPAVAWLIASGTALLGDTPLGVRLGTLIVGTGAVTVVAAIARRLGGAIAEARAAVLMLCTPLAIPGLAIATTDAPALLAIAAALLCIVTAISYGPRSEHALRWWLAAGAAFGCGLLAKFTAGIVGAAVGAALIARPSLRAHFRSPAPWLAAALAMVIATPVLLWNAHHGWIAVRFQLTHGLGAPVHGSVLGRELALVAGQLGILSPGICALVALASARALRRHTGRTMPDAGDARFLLGAVAALVFAFFAYSALHRPVEPNWPAPAVVAGIPLLAASSGLTASRWYARALMTGAACVALVLAQLARPLLPIRASRDPVARAYGWPALAAAGDSARRSIADASGRSVWLGADRYQDAAEIAFHTPRHPVVFALNLGGRRNQYDLWPSFAESAHAGDALVAVLDSGSGGASVAARLRPAFTSNERGPLVALMRGRDTVSVRALWIFRGWRSSWAGESPGRR